MVNRVLASSSRIAREGEGEGIRRKTRTSRRRRRGEYTIKKLEMGKRNEKRERKRNR